VIQAEAVIIAVPLTQLKKNAISFSPPLPTRFTRIVDAINVGNAVKVFAVFSDAFWEHSAQAKVFEGKGDVASIFCPGAQNCVKAKCL
jgi:monoamine oxidase